MSGQEEWVAFDQVIGPDGYRVITYRGEKDPSARRQSRGHDGGYTTWYIWTREQWIPEWMVGNTRKLTEDFDYPPPMEQTYYKTGEPAREVPYEY